MREYFIVDVLSQIAWMRTIQKHGGEVRGSGVLVARPR
jgi:hypothetical protein